MALRQIVSEIRQAVYAVLIEVENPPKPEDKLQVVGTAFAISADGLLMTANHVINRDQIKPAGPKLGSKDKILLAQVHPDGMIASLLGPASVVSGSQQHDYALLKLPIAPGRIQKYLELDLGSRFEGEEVAICGYPLGSARKNPENSSIAINLSLRVAAGIISSQRIDTGSKHLDVDFPILPGNSGGPLFNVATGKVLGSACATLALRGADGSTIGHLGIVKDLRNAWADIRQYV